MPIYRCEFKGDYNQETKTAEISHETLEGEISQLPFWLRVLLWRSKYAFGEGVKKEKKPISIEAKFKL